MVDQPYPAPQDPSNDAPAPLGRPRDDRQIWTTEQLLGKHREVLIQHGDDVYRLRITRHGKLILYK
jgi:hemin uptake protein HemP